jgi:hypothetical protein
MGRGRPFEFDGDGGGLSSFYFTFLFNYWDDYYLPACLLEFVWVSEGGKGGQRYAHV